MIIEYHPAVESELQAIRRYYEDRSPRLGQQFIDEFEKFVLRIAENPQRWMAVDSDIRRALMRKFPYVIYFRQIGPDRIRINVIKHQRRHPSLGRDRT